MRLSKGPGDSEVPGGVCPPKPLAFAIEQPTAAVILEDRVYITSLSMGW